MNASPACVHCGARDRRRIAPLLPLVPLLLGALAALVVFLARGRLGSAVVAVIVTALFGGFVAYLVAFTRSVLRGETCPSCGHDRRGT